MTRPPSPRKVPKQERSRQTVRAIREACGIILERESRDALTTQRIAEVAGVNIASLYQYFPNKDAVLADYFDHEASRIAERSAELFAVIDRLSRRSLEHTLAAIVELELEQHRALRRLDPAFFERYPGGVDVHGKVEALTKARQNPGWERWLPGFLTQHRSRLREGDPEILAANCRGALWGVLERGGRLGRNDGELEAMKTEVLFLLLAYLLKTPPTPADCARLLREVPNRVPSQAPNGAAPPAPSARPAPPP